MRSAREVPHCPNREGRCHASGSWRYHAAPNSTPYQSHSGKQFGNIIDRSVLLSLLYCQVCFFAKSSYCQVYLPDC